MALSSLLLLLLLLPTRTLASVLRAFLFQPPQQQLAVCSHRPYCSSSSSNRSSGSRNGSGILSFVGLRPPLTPLLRRQAPAATVAATAAAATTIAAAAATTGAATELHAEPKAAAAAAAAAAQAELGSCLRPLFPLLALRKKIVPFDNAATTHKPRSVIDAEARVYRHLNANIHRGAYRLAAAATEAVENAREKVARFVGGEAEEIVFTGGATAAINLVARAWGNAFVEEGSELVVSVAEHHANLVPWQQLAKRKNVKLLFIPLHSSSRKLDMERALSLLSPRTRVFAVACVSNVLGAFVQQQELQQLLRRAKARHKGLVTLLDATQALPHAQIRARALGADFLVGSGHKMYGGTGAGFLWGRKEILQQMPPDNFGGEMIDRVQLSGSTFGDPPWRFEAGTLPIAQIVGLGAAVDFLQDVGLSNIAAADVSLSKALLDAVRSLPRVRILSVDPWKQQQQQQQQQGGAAASVDGKGTVPICSFVIEGLSPFDLALCVDQWHHVHLRAGHHCAQPLHEEVLGVSGSLRASLAVYNTEEDVHRFFKAMLKTISRLDSVSRKPAPIKPAAAAAARAAAPA